MSLFRPPRDAAARTAHMQRSIATAASPRLACGLAVAWLQYEVRHLDAEDRVKREIRRRLRRAVDALQPRTPGYMGRLTELTAGVATWAAELAQRNGAGLARTPVRGVYAPAGDAERAGARIGPERGGRPPRNGDR